MTTETNQIDSDAIGIEVSWSFGSGEADAVKIPRSSVITALNNNNFSHDYLKIKDPKYALKHAVRIVPKGRNVIVKELARPRRDTPLAFGVYEKNTRKGESGDDWLCGARVRVEGNSVRSYAPEGQVGIIRCCDIAAEIARIANDLLHTAYNKDLTEMLLDIGRSMNWISRRRNKGGVYFILAKSEGTRKRAERFVGLLQEIASLTSAKFSGERFVPQLTEVYPKPLSNATWSAAAADSFEDHIERLMRDLKTLETDGKMRETTVEKRASECDEIIARAEEYRYFLEEKVDVLSNTLAGIRTRFKDALKGSLDKAADEFEKIEDLTRPEPAVASPKKSKKSAPKPAPEPEPSFDMSVFDV